MKKEIILLIMMLCVTVIAALPVLSACGGAKAQPGRCSRWES